MVRFFYLFLLIAFSLSAENLQKVSLQLKWKHQFQFAGYYMAKELGYYKDAGLDVSFREGGVFSDSVSSVLEGKSTFAVADIDSLVAAAKGADILYLAALFQSSPFAIAVTNKSGIKTLKDFKNKKFMISARKFAAPSLLAMIHSGGVGVRDIEFVTEYRLDDFVTAKVDMMMLYQSNEIYELEKKLGYKPKIFRPQEYGFNFYNDILITSQKELREHPELVAKFREASLKGWKYAFEHIDATVAVILQKYNTQHKTKRALLYEAKVLKSLALLPHTKLGEIKASKLESIFEIYKFFGAIGAKERVDFSKLIYLPKSKFSLFTPQEQAWMKKHPIIRYSEVNWKPLSIIKNNKMQGIMGEYLDIVAKKTGLQFVYVPASSWPDVLKKFQNKEIELVPGVGSSKMEMALGLTSDVYAKYPMVIVTTKKYTFLKTLADLNRKSVTVPEYYTSYNFIKENYPKIKIMPTKSIEEALLLVQSGEAEAFVGHIATSLYYMTKLHLHDLKISGVTRFNFEHRYLIDPEYSQLRGIVNKVFHVISEEQKAKIYSNWVAIKFEKERDYTIAYVVMIVAAVIILLMFYRQRELHRLNAMIEKTKKRFERALFGTDDALVDYDVSKDRIYLSQRWWEMLGIQKRDEIEQGISLEEWYTYIHPNDLPKMRKIFHLQAFGERDFISFVHRQKHSDGHWVWMELRVALTGKARNRHLSGSVSDISKEKEMQLELKQQAQALHEIHDAVIITDLQGNIVNWNRGAQRIFGYSRDEVLGKHVIFLTPKELREQTKKGIESVLKSGYYETETYRITKEQKRIFVSLKLSLLHDEEGKPQQIIGYSQDKTLEKKAEEKLLEQSKILQYQAHHDSLTGLPNRLLFDDRLTHAIESAKRKDTHVALFFIDLDRFKEINDSLGHKAGDKVLKEVAHRLLDVMRAEDTLARLGGDEFTMIIENLETPQDAAVMAQKILEVFKKPFDVESHKMYITCSIGISLFPDDGDFVDDLLKYADTAMYKAKDEGKNNFQYYTPEMTERAFERMLMETSLREAIERDEFVVYFQAQYDGRDDRLVGMEALVRWEHPSMGIVSPAQFIPLAESTGLIVALDRLMMQKAMEQFSKWYKAGYNPGVLSMNLSIQQFKEADFVAYLEYLIKENGCKAEHLQLEVLETELMQNPQEAIEILHVIHELGISLAIDDFGTGYSSLAYLKRLPIDKLKIDQSFVRDLPNKEDMAIVNAVIALAKSLELDLIAEGVENEEQKRLLIKHGCYEIQGYLYARPVSAEEIEKKFTDSVL